MLAKVSHCLGRTMSGAYIGIGVILLVVEAGVVRVPSRSQSSSPRHDSVVVGLSPDVLLVRQGKMAEASTMVVQSAEFEGVIVKSSVVLE